MLHNYQDLSLFSRISKSLDFLLSLVNFVGLFFGYNRKFFVLTFQVFRLEIAKPVMFGKMDKQVVDFDNI